MANQVDKQTLLREKKQYPRPLWTDFRTGLKTPISEEFENYLILLPDSSKAELVTTLEDQINAFELDNENIALSLRELPVALRNIEKQSVTAEAKQVNVRTINSSARTTTSQRSFPELSQMYNASLSQFDKDSREADHHLFQRRVVNFHIEDLKRKQQNLLLSIESVQEWIGLLETYS